MKLLTCKYVRYQLWAVRATIADFWPMLIDSAWKAARYRGTWHAVVMSRLAVWAAREILAALAFAVRLLGQFIVQSTRKLWRKP